MSRTKIAIGGGVFGALAILAGQYFGSMEVRRLKSQVDELQQERTRLIEFADRLSAERRVAQVDILAQQIDESGRAVTTLRWQEIGEGAALGAPQTVEAYGKAIYFEAMVIKFAHELVGKGDPQRSHSLALFRRIFGDQQPPETGFPLPASSVPQGQNTGDMTAELWDKFWRLVDDPKLAERYGVRVAQSEAPAVPVKPGQVWEVTLDAAGGLNLKKVAEHPVPHTPKPANATNNSISS